MSGDERLRDPCYGGVIVDLESARNHLSGFPTNQALGTQGGRANLSSSAGGAVSDKPKYVEIKARTRAELERSFASGDPNAVCDALYSAAQHEQDWRWSQTHHIKVQISSKERKSAISPRAVRADERTRSDSWFSIF